MIVKPYSDGSFGGALLNESSLGDNNKVTVSGQVEQKQKKKAASTGSDQYNLLLSSRNGKRSPQHGISKKHCQRKKRLQDAKLRKRNQIVSSLVIRDVVKAVSQTINDKSADLVKPISPLLAHHQIESKEEQRSAAAVASNDLSIVAAIDEQDQAESNLKQQENTV